MQIILGGKKLTATLIDAGGKHGQLARVKLNQKVRLEPLSSVQVLGHLDQHKDGILAFSPCNNVQGLLSPHTIIEDSIKVPVLLRNMSIKPIKLQKNVVVWIVSEVDQIARGGKLQTTSQVDEGFHINLPYHIVDIPERSIRDLTTEQSLSVKKLLSKGDFDLALFKGIQHRMNTGNALPIKS